MPYFLISFSFYPYIGWLNHPTSKQRTPSERKRQSNFHASFLHFFHALFSKFRHGTLKWWVAPTPSLPTFSNPSLPYEVLGRLYLTMAKNASSRGSMNPLYEGDKEESTVFNLNHQLMAPALANWQLSNSYPSTSWDFRDASTIDLEGRHRKALAFKYSSYRAHKDPKCLGKQVVRLSDREKGKSAQSPLSAFLVPLDLPRRVLPQGSNLLQCTNSSLLDRMRPL